MILTSWDIQVVHWSSIWAEFLVDLCDTKLGRFPTGQWKSRFVENVPWRHFCTWKKKRPQQEISFSNHHFFGAMLVSGLLTKMRSIQNEGRKSIFFLASKILRSYHPPELWFLQLWLWPQERTWVEISSWKVDILRKLQHTPGNPPFE